MRSAKIHTGLTEILERTILFYLLVSTLVSPRPLQAWGHTGHEAVAYVAWQQMNPATRTRVMQLLMLVPTLQNPHNSPKKGHAASIPGFSDWVASLPGGLTDDRRNLYLFMRAATWPDTIKHEWLRDSDTPPAGVTEDAHIGFTDTASHGYWHFVDTAFASDKSTPPPTPLPNAATQIAVLRSTIASSEEALLKSYDLVWLEHLVGDIHQPLHGATRYFANTSDLGGNSVKVKLPAAMKKVFEGTLSKSAPSELHAFWDDLPGEGDPAAALPNAESFAAALPTALNGVSQTDPTVWAQESFELAQHDAYLNPPIGKGPMPKRGSAYSIPQSYYDGSLNVAKARVALAGARLARLLNENLQ